MSASKAPDWWPWYGTCADCPQDPGTTTRYTNQRPWECENRDRGDHRLGSDASRGTPCDRCGFKYGSLYRKETFLFCRDRAGCSDRTSPRPWREDGSEPLWRPDLMYGGVFGGPCVHGYTSIDVNFPCPDCNKPEPKKMEPAREECQHPATYVTEFLLASGKYIRWCHTCGELQEEREWIPHAYGAMKRLPAAIAEIAGTAAILSADRARKAYDRYRKAMHASYPEEYPKDYTPWEELDRPEQAAWILVTSETLKND